MLYGIALILSVYVTTPLIGDMYRQVEGRDLNIEHVEQLKDLGDALRPPLQAHTARFANESERGFCAGYRDHLVAGSPRRFARR